MRTMLDTWCNFPFTRILGSELIGNHGARRGTMPFQQLSRQLQGGSLVPVALNESVKGWASGSTARRN